MSDSEPELSRDVVFDLLSSPRRRMVLAFLRKHDGPCSVTELSEEIAALEYDVDVEDLSRQQRKRVYVSLYQTHVPKLDDAGVVEYDTDAGEVHLTDSAHRMDAYLTETDEGSYPWHYHYLALAVLGAVLLVPAILLGGTAAPLAVGLLVAVAFAGSGAAQLRSHRAALRAPPPELSEESG